MNTFHRRGAKNAEFIFLLFSFDPAKKSGTCGTTKTINTSFTATSQFYENMCFYVPCCGFLVTPEARSFSFLPSQQKRKLMFPQRTLRL